MAKSATGLISGGLDSTVVAAYMGVNYDKSYFLFADYGQKTLERERQAFDDLCEYYNPERAEVVNLRWIRTIGRSALFEEATTLNAKNRKREYVPFRNACLLAAGVVLAETVECDAVLIGSAASDTTCPDNSPQFINAFQDVIQQGTMTEKAIVLKAPLIDLDKKGVIALGLELSAPFDLSWSCHNNIGQVACAQCSNCSSRRQAFSELGYSDPIAYEPA